MSRPSIRPLFHAKTIRLIAALTASANLFTACGPGFTANQAAFTRPPTTSDLYEAETEADLDALKSNKAAGAPFLENADATRAFEEDITGAKRTETDDQLGDALEARHEEQAKAAPIDQDDDSDKSMPPAPLPTDRAQTHKEYEAAKTHDSQSGPSSGSSTAKVSGNREGAAPGPKNSVAQTGQREGQAPAPQSADAISPAMKTTETAPTIPSVGDQAADQTSDSGSAPKKTLGEIPWVPSVPIGGAKKKAAVTKTVFAKPQSDLPTIPPLPPVQENKDKWEKVEQPGSETVSDVRRARRAAARATSERETRREQVIQQISQNICDVINVKSSVPEDLGYLYFDKKSLPSKLPVDSLKAADGNAKKNMFVCLMLPHAIRMDAQVYSQRLEVIRLQSRSRKGTLSDDDNKWLSELKRAYRMPDSGSFTELLARVDVVPLPLILTQAAFESEWGTSNAARITNNLFGMHSADHKNCMPGFDTGGKACLRNFRSVTEGVSMYIRLLDAGTYFGGFRTIRAQLRAAGARLDSVKLLEGMGAYSERGGKYISEVTTIMNSANKIGKYELDEQKIREANANAGRPGL